MNKVIDVSQLINSIDTTFSKEAKLLIEKFDIIQSPRNEVKHYPLDDIIRHSDGEFDVLLANKLYNSASSIWLTFNMVARDAIKSKFGEDVPDGKIGAIKVCPPNRFNYVNSKVDSLLIYSFTYDDPQNDLTKIRSEINFTIEMY